MKKSKSDLASIATLCEQAHGVLSRYYQFKHKPDFLAFLMPPNNTLGHSGRVVTHELHDTDEIYVGLEFGEALALQCQSGLSGLNAHCLTVLAEETSHLQLIIDAAEMDVSVSVTELEVLGEIDRFLALLHWQSTFGSSQSLPIFKNLHDVCDLVFTGQRFGTDANPFYFEVEARAFSHLKKAFWQSWDNTHFDFSVIQTSAAEYLKALRKSILNENRLQKAS